MREKKGLISLTVFQKSDGLHNLYLTEVSKISSQLGLHFGVSSETVAHMDDLF